MYLLEYKDQGIYIYIIHQPPTDAHTYHVPHSKEGIHNSFYITQYYPAGNTVKPGIPNQDDDREQGD